MKLSRFLILFAAFAGVASAADKPNIIYIMSDDMGYSDIGCYGSEIATPNLDALAAGGLRFTQFYNTARCCPTRASLMSGLYPHQAGVGHMMNDRGYDGYRGDLNRNCVTIPEALKSAGYRSYMSGKWHVTPKVNPNSELDKHNWPVQRGFDRFYGTIHGAGSFFDPNSLTRDNELISPWADPKYKPETFYYTDAISDHAASFIQEHHKESDEQPFFMYVAYTAAHWPMHALPEDIAKYKGKYDGGYDEIRNARYRKMIELGVVDEESTVNWPIPDDWKESEHLEWDIANMEVYAAMIDSMDQGIGRIVAALKETGQFENTLICFFQDNGGCAENYGRNGKPGGPRAGAPTLPPLADDYLQPDMNPKQTRDGYPIRQGKGVMPGAADTLIGYGKGWATVSNTPFKEYKHWTHEGGISTPLIVHWPAKVTRAGELETTPGHLVDLMATAVDISGATYPKTYHDNKEIKPMEGKSLVSAFEGKGIEREAIYWEHEGNRAIRVGDLKLVGKGAKGKWELYNIAKDRSEQNNLADSQTEVVEKLAAMWQAYAERANVLPLNPQPPKPDRSAFNLDQTRFDLNQGDDLDREKAPFVENRGFKVAAIIEPAAAGANGVIVAQGGTNLGWSLYLKDGTLNFATTQNGKRTVVTGEMPISAKATEVTAIFGKKGQITLTTSGEKNGKGKSPGFLKDQPLDGLQVGEDTGGAVGDYEAPFSFEGKVIKCAIELD
ncbi:MAG: arylsulfatase A-like enzyme [Verrucomicrobiales bacterium]|jgi:arylsulfatase A-like enzyme